MRYAWRLELKELLHWLETHIRLAQIYQCGEQDATYRWLKKVLSNSTLRRRLREGSLERAQAFSWERAAQEALAVCREVMG